MQRATSADRLAIASSQLPSKWAVSTAAYRPGMRTRTRTGEQMVLRRVFPGWSLTFLRSFSETFIEEDAYWHAYDARRSVSLTSFLMVDQFGVPVDRQALAERLLPEGGADVEEAPPGLLGWGMHGRAIQPARAKRTLSGILAADGRALVVTITSDDAGWSRNVWLSIRNHPVPLSDDLPTAADAAEQVH